jgi:ATP-dependent exoDNAse (exonuclease V) alpha subunit
VVVGKAGAGKTFALDAARAAWQASGFTVIGCSTAARAAAQLQADAGIPSATIARLDIELARRPLPPDSVLVVDEAAMVGTRQLAHLAEVTEAAGAKLLLVGDDRQLPAIDAGGGFRAITQARPPIRLDDNRRQSAVWERAAVDAIAAGRAGGALDAYTRHGRVTVADTAESQRDTLVADWHANRVTGGSGPMIALHRSDVDDLNQRARRARISAGELPAAGLEIGGRIFAVGDEVTGRRNDYRAGILNGTRGTVTAVHPDTTVTLRTEGGEEMRTSRSYLRGGHLDHGYAMTVHQTQGATFDQAFVLGDDRLYREAGYVALSRASDAARLYVVGVDMFDEHDTHRSLDAEQRLRRALTSSRAEPSIRELTIDR